jgi:hypothetical protein
MCRLAKTETAPCSKMLTWFLSNLRRNTLALLKCVRAVRTPARDAVKGLDLPARSRSRLPKNLFGEQVGEGRAETFHWIIQMAPKILQRPVHFLHFNSIKYEKPHSKTLEAFLAGEPSKLLFQRAKVLLFV